MSKSSKETLPAKVKRVVKKVTKKAKEEVQAEPTFGSIGRGYRTHTGGIVRDNYLIQ